MRFFNMKNLKYKLIALAIAIVLWLLITNPFGFDFSLGYLNKILGL